MGDSLVGFGKALGGSIAVGALPEDGEVALAIRLEGDPLAIGGPNGIAIRSRSWKRQTTRGNRSGQLVNPNARFLAVNRFEKRFVCHPWTREGSRMQPVEPSAARLHPYDQSTQERMYPIPRRKEAPERKSMILRSKRQTA